MLVIPWLALASMLTLSTNALAQTGFYVGAGGGYVNLDQDESDIAAAAGARGVAGRVTELDDDSFGWKIFAGYQFNIYFAAELGYTDLGDASATFVTTAPTAATVNVDADAGALTGAVIGSYPLNPDFGIFGKIGGQWWDVDGTATAAVGGATASVSADDDGVDLLFGLGASYNVNEQVGLRLEWERYQGVGDSDAGTDADVDYLGGSLLYRF